MTKRTCRATRAAHLAASIRHMATRSFLKAACALACMGIASLTSPQARAADAPVSSPTAAPQNDATKAPPHRQAAGKPASTSRVEAICSSADLNHDGNVSLDEYHQDIVQSWHNLSPDAAGYVQLSDLAQIPGIGKGRLKRLAAADKDGDGKLSFKEVVESRMAYFDAADTDQNDQLSIQECVAYERKLRQGTK